MKTKTILIMENCFLNNWGNSHNWNRWFSQKSENRPTLVLCCLKTHDLYITKFSKTWTSMHAFNNILAKIKLPTNTQGFEKIVSSKIPCAKAQLNICKNHIILSPHGIHNPNCACTQNGQCTKCYQKDFQKQMINGINIIVLYQWSSNNHNITLRIDIILDNCWIVPHNLQLFTKYNSH